MSATEYTGPRIPRVFERVLVPVTIMGENVELEIIVHEATAEPDGSVRVMGRPYGAQSALASFASRSWRPVEA
jgi:hypothetical protein